MLHSSIRLSYLRCSSPPMVRHGRSSPAARPGAGTGAGPSLRAALPRAAGHGHGHGWSSRGWAQAQAREELNGSAAGRELPRRLPGGASPTGRAPMFPRPPPPHLCTISLSPGLLNIASICCVPYVYASRVPYVLYVL